MDSSTFELWAILCLSLSVVYLLAKDMMQGKINRLVLNAILSLQPKDDAEDRDQTERCKVEG